MPLIDNNFGGLEQVDIPCPDGTVDTYWLRRELGFYLVQKYGGASGVQFLMPWGEVKDGNLDNLEEQREVKMKIDMHEINLDKLEARIKRWSHDAPPSRKNIKRIPLWQMRILLEAIAKLEREEGEKAVDAPLAEPSGE